MYSRDIDKKLDIELDLAVYESLKYIKSIAETKNFDSVPYYSDIFREQFKDLIGALQ